MEGGEDVSIEELASNLSTYKGQLNEVRRLLVDDPGNSEYVDMEKELEEGIKVLVEAVQHDLAVITLTQELWETAKRSQLSGVHAGSNVDASHDQHHVTGISQVEVVSTPSGHHSYPIGTKVQSVWSEDGEWYNAMIEGFTPNGYFVSYDGWGNKEEVDPDNVRPIEGAVDALREAERVAEATRQAIKRKIAQAAETDFQSRALPAKLRIEPNDPENVKAAKRKKIHAFKSKVRFEQLEVAQNKRQNAWQQFQTTKGKSKKIGFFSGRKRESIFKSPDDPTGKVGVTGSGKGLTEFQKREKHLYLKGAAAADIEE